MRTIFTTDQVAKICKVAPRTASKWFDSGRLRGYRIPGSKDRRIPHEHLIRFLKEHGMPLGELEDESKGKLLIVGTDGNVLGQLRNLMPSEDFKIESAANGFEAGIQAEYLHPDCIVIDFGMGRHEATLIAQNLRKNTDYADAVLVALLSDDDTASGFDRTPFNETFRKPFDVGILADRVRILVERKIQDEDRQSKPSDDVTQHVTDPTSPSDNVAITADWPETNRRRAELIQKKVARTITPAERTELEHLQSLATARANLIAPLPQAELDAIYREAVGGAE